MARSSSARSDVRGRPQTRYRGRQAVYQARRCGHRQSSTVRRVRQRGVCTRRLKCARPGAQRQQ